MQETVASANSPQGSGAYLVCGRLAAILDDAVAGADVVQRKVAERMDYLVTQSRRNRKRSTINRCAGSSGLEGSCVTNGTAY